MRTRRRILFNVLTLLSAALWIVTIAFWVRSYWTTDLISHSTNPSPSSGWRFSHANFLAANGYVMWHQEVFQFKPDAPGMRSDQADQYLVTRRPSERFGTWRRFRDSMWFEVTWHSPNPLGKRPGVVAAYFHYIRVPLWAIVVLSSILPAILVRHNVRLRNMRRAGLCPTCGYDLRATPGRCPECGRAAM